GIELAKHRSKTFDDLLDSSFDLVVTMSPEAHHRAMEMTRTMACDVEYWPTLDPSMTEGSREAVLDAYREVRDEILGRIKMRFPLSGSPPGKVVDLSLPLAPVKTSFFANETPAAPRGLEPMRSEWPRKVCWNSRGPSPSCCPTRCFASSW